MDDDQRRFWIASGIVVMIALTEVVGQACLKKARTQNIKWMLIVGMVVYLGVAYLLYVCYDYAGMGHTNLLWSCMSIILAILVGYHMFKEPYNSYNWVAAAFAMGAIYFAHRGREAGQ